MRKGKGCPLAEGGVGAGACAGVEEDLDKKVEADRGVGKILFGIAGDQAFGKGGVVVSDHGTHLCRETEGTLAGIVEMALGVKSVAGFEREGLLVFEEGKRGFVAEVHEPLVNGVKNTAFAFAFEFDLEAGAVLVHMTEHDHEIHLLFDRAGHLDFLLALGEEEAAVIHDQVTDFGQLGGIFEEVKTGDICDFDIALVGVHIMRLDHDLGTLGETDGEVVGEDAAVLGGFGEKEGFEGHHFFRIGAIEDFPSFARNA